MYDHSSVTTSTTNAHGAALRADFVRCSRLCVSVAASVVHGYSSTCLVLKSRKAEAPKQKWKSKAGGVYIPVAPDDD